MFRRGLGPAVLNDLLLKRLAIAHMATEVRGGMPAASAPNCERAHLPAHAFTVFADETDGKGTEFGL
jgi:hypothetical protein